MRPPCRLGVAILTRNGAEEVAMRDHDVHGREEADEEALDSSAAHRALPLTVRTRMRAFGHFGASRLMVASSF